MRKIERRKIGWSITNTVIGAIKESVTMCEHENKKSENEFDSISIPYFVAFQTLFLEFEH